MADPIRGLDMHFFRALALFALCVISSFAVAAQLEVITLKYRSAEQLIPVIRPLIAPGGTVSGMQNQLILRTTKANLADIRKVLAGLDALPRRLMIYVRQDAESASAQSGAELGGSMGSGAVVTGNQAPRQERPGVTARIYASRGATDDRITQQIQVLEGNAATIHVGQSIAVPAQTVTRSINGLVLSDSVAYRDFATGFEVVPRVSGEQVLLDISPRRETPAGSLGGADVQRAVTTARGRLGEWFELGGSSRDEARSDSGLLIGAAGLRKDKRHIWVKVEEIK
jgi:type II secretory pathway component GspD/PulD (secretin)